MAQPSTHVSTALPGVGFCAVTLKPGRPPISVFEWPDTNGYLVVYDRTRWTREQIEQFAQMRFGDYQLVEPANGGA